MCYAYDSIYPLSMVTNQLYKTRVGMIGHPYLYCTCGAQVIICGGPHLVRHLCASFFLSNEVQFISG